MENHSELTEPTAERRKVLLVYPEYPSDTYWNFGHTMPIIGRKASMPPLGLVTVAAMLPDRYELKLVDMNIEPLTDEHLQWADVVFTSTMIVQSKSLSEVVERAKRIGLPVVAGGPHPTTSKDQPEMEGLTHLVLGEVEDLLNSFLTDFDNGCAQRVYETSAAPDVTRTPIPRFDLLNLDAYGTMAVQYSRGCPFLCEFCDIWKIYGRRPRMKTHEQFLKELDVLYELGWRGSLFVVDDNFIGNVRVVKDFIPHIKAWQEQHGYPFHMFTEASVNLAHHESLLSDMRDAGFNMVFLGIETPSAESLKETKKTQNMRDDLLTSVHRIQANGMEVSAGFIVGFDSDREDIFDRQIRFIDQAGIPMAMVGLLTALRGTDLYDRMQKEGRLLAESDGNNTHFFESNFKPKMPIAELVAGYKKILASIYDRTLKNYFNRCRTFLNRLGPSPHFVRTIRWSEIKIFFRAMVRIGGDKGGPEFFRFLIWSLANHPKRFAEAVRLGVMGYHFRLITQGALGLAHLREFLGEMEKKLATKYEEVRSSVGDDLEAFRAKLRGLYSLRKETLKTAGRHSRGLPRFYRAKGRAEITSFLRRVDEYSTLDIVQEWMLRLKEFIRSTEDDLHHRVTALKEGVEGFSQSLRQLNAEREEKIAEVKRRIALLPREFQLIGQVEYAKFTRRLDDLFAPKFVSGG